MAKKMRKFASAGSIGRRASSEAMDAVSDILKSGPAKVEADDTIKKATAPQKAQSFSEAFKAARAKGEKTFSWAGKPGMTFTTKMAGEEIKKPAARAPATKDLTGINKPTGGYSSAAGEATREANRADMRKKAAAARKPTLKERFQSGTMFKKAKGGSIDGCAIRGKTRAPMKKGK